MQTLSNADAFNIISQIIEQIVPKGFFQTTADVLTARQALETLKPLVESTMPKTPGIPINKNGLKRGVKHIPAPATNGEEEES